MPSFSSLDIISWLVDDFTHIDLPSPSTPSSQCNLFLSEHICISKPGTSVSCSIIQHLKASTLIPRISAHSYCISFPRILYIPVSALSLILSIFVQVIHGQKLGSINVTMFFMQINSSLLPPS